jgi:hypothetical protein
MLLSSLALLALPAHAQGAEYFPQTGHSVSGRFLSFWEQNGGLPVFGYPLTDERNEDGRTVQYFERARFEYAPEHAPPYDVLLGRLGVQILQQRSVNWKDWPTSPGPAEGCLWFEATGHNVCNQLQNQDIGFLNYWRTHGLEFDGKPDDAGFPENMALFGAPITEPYVMTIDGEEVQVQWFERARFEWHANNPPGYRVLLGRLGTQVIDTGGVNTVSQVALYFIARGDEGQSGIGIGCGDSAIPVEISIEPTPAPLTAAMEQLLAAQTEYYGQSGLYNALHRSTLSLERAAVENGVATIALSGNVIITGGECETPRFEAQIKQTARQFPTVDRVVVYINGQRMNDLLSAQ